MIILNRKKTFVKLSLLNKVIILLHGLLGAFHVTNGGFSCLSNPCLFGVCIDDLNSTYSCYCIDGYTGVQCQTNWDECWSSPCLNGATCIDGVAQYNCSCPEGFIGQNCEENLDECLSNPCQNGGSCNDKDNGYVCVCLPGFLGTHCENDLAVCEIGNGTRCNNGGQCIEGKGLEFSCECQPGWQGEYCENDINECDSSPCQNGGICLDKIASYACACSMGFTGQNCEENVLLCQDSPCQNNALCLMEEGVPVCYCVPDYHGEKCEFQYDECQLGPRCVNGGTCIDGVDDFSCSCPPPLTGIFCECLIQSDNELDCNYTSQFITTTEGGETSPTTIYHSSVYESVTEYTFTTTPYKQVTTEKTDSTTSFTSDFTTIPYTTSFTTVFVPTTNYTFPTTYNLVVTTTPGMTDYTEQTTISTESDSNVKTTTTEHDIEMSTIKDTTTPYSPDTTALPGDESTTNKETTITTSQDFTTPSSIEIDTSTTTTSQSITTPTNEPKTTTEMYTDPIEIETTTPKYFTIKTTTETETRRSPTTIIPELSTETTISETIFFTDLPSEASAFSSTLTTTSIPIFTTDLDNANETRSSTHTFETTTNQIPSTMVQTDDNSTKDCASFTCQNGGTCVNTSEGMKCVCRFDRHGKQCELPLLIHNAAFAGDSYISHKLYSIDQSPGGDQSEIFKLKLTMQVEVKVRTRSTEGLIVLATAQGNYGNHYMALFLHRGLLQFQFSCGLQTMLLSELEAPINTGEELLIQVELDFIRDYSHCNASLRVNDTLTMSGDQPTWLNNHNLVYDKPIIQNMWVHLGGAPQAPFGLSNEIVNEQGFTGCLHSLNLNNVVTNIFNDAHDGFGVTECGSLACLSNPCQNGATCVEDDANHYKNEYNIDNEFYSNNIVIQSMHTEADYDKWRCKCPTGYMGKTCEISICDNNPCQYGGTCVPFPGSGYICLCPLGKHGHYCEHNLEVAQPSFSGSIKGLSSYIAYSVPVPLEQGFELSFKIIPNTITQIALLAFLGQVGYHDEKSDHLAVSFIQGYVMLTWNLGAGPRRIFIQKPIEMRPEKEAHEIHIGRIGRKAWLSVNGKMNVTGRSSGTADELDVIPTLYLGGYDHANFTTLPHDLPLHTGFQGCIFDVKFKSGVVTVPLQSTKSIRGRSVGQCGTKECHRYACRHDGACLQYGATFTCICQEGWYGPLCLEQLNLCDSFNNQCAVGSFCVPLVNKYECDCPTGKSGKNCETKIVSLSDISLSGRRSFLSVQWPSTRVKAKIRVLNNTQHENEIVSKHYQISKQFQYHSVGITVPKSVSNSIFLKFVNEQEFPLDFDRLKTTSANLPAPFTLLNNERQQHTIQSFSIELQIRPLSERGLLVYYGTFDNDNDKGNIGFVSLSLQGGVVEYRISGGHSEVIIVRSSRILAIGEWHKIKISQNGKRLILLVEGSATQTSLPPGFSFLQKRDLIYIGGLPDLSRLPHHAVSGFPVPFRGCIRQLHINGLRIVLNESNIQESRNIADCDGTACGGDTCDLGGHCWLDEKLRAHCKCPQYSRGDRCETLEHCNVIKCKNGGFCGDNGECHCPIGWGGFYCEIAMGEYSAPSFHGSSYLKLPPQKISQKDKRAESSYQVRLKHLLEISFKFSTIHENGLIIWSNNSNAVKNSSKFLGIGIEKGHLKFTSNLKTLNDTNIDITIGYYVSDGAWHNLAVKMNPENTVLLLDDKIVFSEQHKSLNLTNLLEFNENISVDDTFYIGGAPNRNSISKLTANKFHNAYFGCLQDISFGTDQHILINDFSGFEGENLGQCELYDEFI